MARRLAEVAKYAGVSEATVSRVLNQKPGVAKATQELVLTALDVLGYERPTQLRGERARLVGLVLPELQNPIFPAFAEVVADALAKRGFTPVLCTRTSAGISEADYVEMLLEHHVSGVIFCGGLYAQAAADHEHYQRLRDRGLPAVLVNAAYDDLGFPRISSRTSASSATSVSGWCSARSTTSRRPASSRPSRRSVARSSSWSAASSGWRAARRPAPGC